jgi:perosamine synthetase
MQIWMSRPSMTESELAAVKQVFDTGWLGEGALTERFEKRICEYTGAPFAVALNTGTSALHLALAEMGVGPGDEVILPSFTFASDPMAVHLCGAKPVFADIDRQSLNLDPAAIDRLISPRTKAVMPTDYAGLPADVPAIRRVLGDRPIRIVRDASHSFGSLIGERPLGVWCGEDATCFSFDPIKNITCGEGGAVLVRDGEQARRLTAMRRLGFEESAWDGLSGNRVQDRRVSMTGYRYHMGNLNAAIGLAQMDRMAGMLDRKRSIAMRYDGKLAAIPGVTLLPRDYRQVAPFMYPILVAAGDRDPLVATLVRQGIHAGLRYFPCHRQPLFESSGEHLPVTERIVRELICLPIYADLTDDEADRVVSAMGGHFEARGS